MAARTGAWTAVKPEEPAPGRADPEAELGRGAAASAILGAEARASDREPVASGTRAAGGLGSAPAWGAPEIHLPWADSQPAGAAREELVARPLSAQMV